MAPSSPARGEDANGKPLDEPVPVAGYALRSPSPVERSGRLGRVLTILSGLLASLSYATSDMFSQRVTRETRALTQMVWVLVDRRRHHRAGRADWDGLPDGGEWRGAGLAALAGVLYFGALFCLLRGLQVGDLGLVSALMSLQGAYVAVAVILLGEPVTPAARRRAGAVRLRARCSRRSRAAPGRPRRAVGVRRRRSLRRRHALLQLRRHRLALPDGHLAHASRCSSRCRSRCSPVASPCPELSASARPARACSSSPASCCSPSPSRSARLRSPA